MTTKEAIPTWLLEADPNYWPVIRKAFMRAGVRTLHPRAKETTKGLRGVRVLGEESALRRLLWHEGVVAENFILRQAQ